MSALDRDAAREVLSKYMRGNPDTYSADRALDALKACVRPASPQGLERDALREALTDEDVYIAEFVADDSFGSGHLELATDARVELTLDKVLALLRPVEGVLLAPWEVQIVREWWDGYDGPTASGDFALVHRLKEASP